MSIENVSGHLVARRGVVAFPRKISIGDGSEEAMLSLESAEEGLHSV